MPQELGGTLSPCSEPSPHCRLPHVELSFDKPGVRRTILALCVLIMLVLMYQGVRLGIADALVRSDSPKTIARGVALEPGNGDAWDRLGRFHQWNLSDPNPELAATEYLHAVRDDPNSAHFLMDLAGAYEANGDVARAKDAWNRARAVYPSSAEVEWNYGNFLLRQQGFGEGYQMIRRAVEAEPSLLPLAISRTWRASQDIHALLDQALPATPSAYLKALDFFASTHDAEAAIEVWHRLVELKQPVALPQTFPFFQELIDEDRSVEARQSWAEAVAAAGLAQEEKTGSSLLWNGDFSMDFQNGGLGWRWNNPLGTSIDFDAPPPGQPGRSVRIDFDGGANTDLSEPLEYIPVGPDRAYRLRGFIRTQGITTDSGMRFHLTDPNHEGSVDISTDNLTLSHPWTPVEADFTTGPATHFLQLCLRRPPSQMFDNKLGGSVWIANLSLEASPNPQEPRPK